MTDDYRVVDEFTAARIRHAVRQGRIMFEPGWNDPANVPRETCHGAQGTTMSNRKRGFAGMDPAKQRAIASMGGKRAHEIGTAHQFTPEEAREAGKKSHASGNAHQFTSEEAAAAGRIGGRAKAQQVRDAKKED